MQTGRALILVAGFLALAGPAAGQQYYGDKKYGEFEIVDQDFRMSHLYVFDVATRKARRSRVLMAPAWRRTASCAICRRSTPPGCLCPRLRERPEASHCAEKSL